MKANELMIGDWVVIESYAEDCDLRSCDKEVVYDYGKVVSIDRYAKNFEDVYVHTDNTIGLNEGYPQSIPLTEEILKANGFKHQLSMNNVDHGWNLGKLWLTKDLELFIYRVHVKLSTVHELQHALRLCGLNELADNFKLKEE